MYRIRFHGRGGQGIKTASRILGTAFFLAGYEVQDAPRYGAERRGAPISANVRASRELINERGVIGQPDLVVAVDSSLLPLPQAGVLRGAQEHSLLLLNATDLRVLTNGLEGFPGRVVLLPPLGDEAAAGPLPLMAVACAGAACRLSGVISAEALREAIATELSWIEPSILAHNLELALSAYNRLDEQAGWLAEGPASPLSALEIPRWAELEVEPLLRATPIIRNGHNSLLSMTGLWRTERPVIDPEKCKQCWWVCGTFCPDGVIYPVEGAPPTIDYDHCKGCLICLAQCPSHAISAQSELMLLASGTHPQPGETP